MIKKREIDCRRIFLFGILWISLAGTGVTYAGWSDGLKIGGDFTTGVMDAGYSPDASCRISLVNGEGKEEEDVQEAEAVLREDGKAVDITAPIPLYSEAFLEHPDSLIKIEFPIKAGASGTINSAELWEADFQGEPSEELSLEPSRIVLIPEGSTQEYELSGDEAPAFGSALEFDVFRAIREREGNAVGVIYLRMKEESRSMLAELPSELELKTEEAGLDSSEAELVITYQFQVPVYIEQGHKDTAPLQRQDTDL